MQIMDLKEAKACIDEYCTLLADTSALLRPDIPAGELGASIEKLNGRSVEALEAQVKESRALSIVICEHLAARSKASDSSPLEYVELLTALNRLAAARDKAEKERGEFLRKVAIRRRSAESSESPISLRESLDEFRRKRYEEMKKEKENQSKYHD